MANKNTKRIIKLPPETIQRMEEAESRFAEADHAIEVMKKLGMDTSKLEEKMTWAKEVRKTLLKEFG